MNISVVTIVSALVVGVVAFVAAWILAHRIGEKSVSSSRSQAARIITEAEKEAQIKKKESLHF